MLHPDLRRDAVAGPSEQVLGPPEPLPLLLLQRLVELGQFLPDYVLDPRQAEGPNLFVHFARLVMFPLRGQMDRFGVHLRESPSNLALHRLLQLGHGSGLQTVSHDDRVTFQGTERFERAAIPGLLHRLTDLVPEQGILLLSSSALELGAEVPRALRVLRSFPTVFDLAKSSDRFIEVVRVIRRVRQSRFVHLPEFLVLLRGRSGSGYGTRAFRNRWDRAGLRPRLLGATGPHRELGIDRFSSPILLEGPRDDQHAEGDGRRAGEGHSHHEGHAQLLGRGWLGCTRRGGRRVVNREHLFL